MNIKQGMTRNDIEVIGKAHASSTGIARIIGDFDLYCDPHEKSLGQWLSTTGFWESWITAWVLDNIRVGDVCLDLGANYGYFSRIMQRIAGREGFVYAIEANPTLANLVNKSVCDFPMHEGSPVVVLSMAAWNETGFLELSIDNTMLGGSSVMGQSQDEPSGKYSLEIPAVCLDDVVGREIDFLKMDIEGAEPAAWKGMKRIVSRLRVGIIEISRGVPPIFIEELACDFELSLVDYSGSEETFSWDKLNSGDDPRMLVIRRKSI